MVDLMSGLYDPSSLFTPAALAAMGALLVVYIIVMLAVYIYSALALMTIAKKTKTENGWLAFIPIANFYLITQMAGQSGWWTLAVLLPIIPIIGSLAMVAISIWFFWIICEKIRRPGWWSLLLLIPIVNLVILGVMAWGK